jgi:hypothetical protein
MRLRVAGPSVAPVPLDDERWTRGDASGRNITASTWGQGTVALVLREPLWGNRLDELKTGNRCYPSANMNSASLLLVLLCISPFPVFSQVKYETEPVPSSVQGKLDQVAGKVVYSCARNGVFMLETKEQVRFYGAEIQPGFLSVLSPWKIVGVDKIGDMGSRYLMAIRLDADKLPMVIGGLVIDPASLTSASDPLQVIAEAANLATTIRGTNGGRFTDLNAVMSGQIHRGMTEGEMICALGQPERVNSDETSAQNVYRDGSLIVYTSNGIVTNVQRSR